MTVSRRRSRKRAYDIRIRIVCTDKSTHPPHRVGTIEWYSDGALPGRVQVRTNGESRVHRHQAVDRADALKHGFPRTYTFTCPVCSRNMTLRRQRWQPWLLELESLGIAELDMSCPDRRAVEEA
ncbi:hypothetical protein RDE2_13680 [Rhodococcus sp. RDE2]|nr:hypothetical protein RDE2_13680 [Rhodococcus sp. RDE2]